MTPFQQLVQELTSTFRYGTAFGCSRSELAVDEPQNIVMLLLRTKPELSEWMFSTPSLQYPWPLLQNYDFVLSKLWRQIMEERTVRPAISELMRAAMVSVSRGNYHGTSASFGTFGLMLHVPAAAEAPEWQAVLLDPRYPSFIGEAAPAVELFVVHLPDVPIDQLNDTQLHRLAELSTGWNFLEVHPPDFIPNLAQAIRVAAAGSQVIAEY